MVFLLLVAGLVSLVIGGDLLVRGAVTIARHFKVSPLLIGLTLVGFGTSLPELLTSLQAAFAGAPGISIGNVVGSNTANILLILGVAAVIRPIATTPAALRRDGVAVVVAALACLALVAAGELTRLPGFVLVVMLVGYVLYTYRQERTVHDAGAELHEAEAETVPALSDSLAVAITTTLVGFALTMFGAYLLVDGAITLAEELGISQTIIGVTIVAVGTSLPELITSVMASIRRQGDIALGNIMGSNIFNVLFILGVTALVKPIPVPEEIIRLDIWVMLAATALLIAFSATGWKICRREGALFLVGYGLYMALLAGNL